MLDYERGYQAIFQFFSEVKSNMSLYDGVDIDGVPMQSNSTEGTDITKLCELIYIFVDITLYSRDFMRGKIANF